MSSGSMPARKTREQLLRGIFDNISDEPITTNEIATKINSNWDTVKDALKILINLGLVKEQTSEGGVLYIRSNTKKKEENGTIFNIRIDDDKKNLTKCLFKQIRIHWKNQYNFNPGATQVQKIAVEVADRLDLPVPRAWYLFGEMCLLIYKKTDDYDYDKEIVKKQVPLTKLNRTITEVESEIAKFKNTSELRKYQYETKDNQLYKTGFILKSLLSQRDYSPKTIEKLKEASYLLLRYYPEFPENKDVNELVTAYVSILNQILSKKTLLENYIHWTLLDDVFDYLWDVIAVTNLIDSLSTPKFGYSRKELIDYVSIELESRILDCEIGLGQMVELLGKEDTSTDSLMKFVDEHDKIENIDAKKRRECFDNFLEGEDSDIFGEFDLN